MEHRRLGLLGATRSIASRLLVPALLAPCVMPSAGCGRRDAPAVAADSASPPPGGQVGTLPAPDSTSPAARLRDSAAALDVRFQRARDSLNRDSRALDTLDRRSADYARRFDAWRARARTADSLRAARDRLRARLARLR
jgi:hypothetical protein